MRGKVCVIGHHFLPESTVISVVFDAIHWHRLFTTFEIGVLQFRIRGPLVVRYSILTNKAQSKTWNIVVIGHTEGFSTMKKGGRKSARFQANISLSVECNYSRTGSIRESNVKLLAFYIHLYLKPWHQEVSVLGARFDGTRMADILMSTSHSTSLT